MWRGLGLCSALGTRLSECVLCVTCQTSSPPAPHCSRKPRAERHRRETPSRQPNGHGTGATSSADGPARRAGRRARDGEVRKAVPAPEPRKAPAGSRQHLDSGTAMRPVRRAPPTARLDALAAGPATARSGRPYPRQAPRKAPAGSPAVRCCSTSRVVASQDVCEVARGAGRVEKYTDTDGRVWDAAAHYIFSCRAGAECFARQKGCSAQLARTSNAKRAAPMCNFCRRQQLATNLAGPARRTVSARRARCGCGRGFLVNSHSRAFVSATLFSSEF